MRCNRFLCTGVYISRAALVESGHALRAHVLVAFQVSFSIAGNTPCGGTLMGGAIGTNSEAHGSATFETEVAMVVPLAHTSHKFGAGVCCRQHIAC
jgi:hypothetical protein